MKKMFFYEMKKIFMRKIVWAGILAALLLSVMSFTNFSNMSPENIAYEKEIAAKYKGTLSDEKVQQMLQDFMPTQEQLTQWKGISVAYIGRNSMQQAVHRFFANGDGTWNGKTVQDVFGDQEVQVGYHSGWFDLSRNLVKLMILLAILAVMITAPVFAGEYGGMDQILLTSRYGRSRCALAKILASFAASMGLLAVFLLGNLAAALALMGTEGLDTSTLFCGVQYENYMPYNISCGTMLMYQSGLAVSGVLMVVGMTVLISAVSKSQVVSLILSAFALLGPMLLSLSENNPLFRLVGLLPVWLFQFSTLMSVGYLRDGIFYSAMALPVCIIVVLLCAVLARRFWRRHQVF